MIDFELPIELVDLKERTDEFIRKVVMPYEKDARQKYHGPTDELRVELVAKAREAGLLSPHAPRQYGGLGLDHRAMAVIFESAGYSTLGPLALNIQAPDEGNTNLLHQVATPEQKERWLVPMVRGEMRSVFSMTEPDNGAGSDPSLMKTTATPDGDDYIIHGRKWFITGMPGAGYHIIMAKTLDHEGRDIGATMFMCDADTPGIEQVRMLDTLDSNSPGGHCEVDYNQVRIPAFGKAIIEHEGVGFQLADNKIDLHTSRLVTWHGCWMLDQGEKAQSETSLAKVHCSEALGRVVDRSMQVLGAKGISTDTVIERIYRDIRAFRIYDGPSEVHRWVLSKS